MESQYVIDPGWVGEALVAHDRLVDEAMAGRKLELNADFPVLEAFARSLHPREWLQPKVTSQMVPLAAAWREGGPSVTLSEVTTSIDKSCVKVSYSGSGLITVVRSSWATVRRFMWVDVTCNTSPGNHWDRIGAGKFRMKRTHPAHQVWSPFKRGSDENPYFVKEKVRCQDV